jgi:hypothetical protein
MAARNASVAGREPSFKAPKSRMLKTGAALHADAAQNAKLAANLI